MPILTSFATGTPTTTSSRNITSLPQNTSNRRRRPLCRQPLLVWLDGLPRRQDPLDRPHALGPLHRFRHLFHLPLSAQLHRQRLPHVRGLRARRQHLHALRLQGRIFDLRDVHVRRHGRAVGEYAVGMCGAAVGADAGCVFAVWEED